MYSAPMRGRSLRSGPCVSAVMTSLLLAGMAVAPRAQAASGVSSNTWSPAGSMTSPRSVHQATLLLDGRVLVTGGVDAAGALSSAEVYDPSSNTWNSAANMGAQRSRHVAVLLADGRVLVAGGRGALGDSLRSTESYDPTTNTWTATESMGTARDNFAAVRLTDGSVLVAGGTSSIAAPFVTKGAEIYDPSTGRWRTTGHMLNARFGHSMTLLRDRRVLVAGGDLPGGDNAQTRTAEIYDPSTGSWSATGSMNVARSFFSATLLADGRVLVAGGRTEPQGTLTVTAEIYDPATGRWNMTGSMAVARGGFGLARESVRLADGNVLVVGDAIGAPGASAEIYDPRSGSWSFIDSMSVERKDHVTVELADGRVLVAGGSDHTHTLLATAEVYTS
jgi:N-acetylneuraminic acid mutarotase